jgi:anti-anti-sigma factor
MAMPDDGRVLYAVQNGTCVLRFQGPIRYTMAASFDAFLNELLAERAPRMICADLSDTESIDSTGIGLLAKIAIAQRRAGRSKPLLFSSKRDINEVLCSMSLDEVFQMIEQPPEADDLEAVAPTQPTERELRRTIFEAHLLLSELSEGNRAMFKDVVEGLAREMHDDASAPAPTPRRPTEH